MKLSRYLNVIENSTSLFLVKIIDLFLTIWLIPFLIFRVGISNYGVYAFSLSIIIILTNVINYGFDLDIVREISQNKKNAIRLSKIVSKVLSIKLFLFCVLVLLYTICILAIDKLNENKELYFYSLLILFSHLFSLRWFFLGIEKMKYLFLISLNKTLLFVLLAYFIIYQKENFIYIPLVEGIANSLVFIITFFIVVDEFKLKIRLLRFVEINKYLKKAFSSFINLIIPSTFNNFVIFLVGVLGYPASVSITQIGVKTLSAFSTINSILTKVLYPVINRTKTYKRHYVLLMIIGTLLSFLMFFSSTSIVQYWLKYNTEEFTIRVIKVIKLLSLIPFLVAVISCYGINGLLVYFKDKEFSYINIFSVFILVVCSLFLIPNHGSIGAALALLLSRIIYAILSFLFFNYSLKK